MKLIIDIPETLYEVTKDMIRNDMGTSTINKAIANGIPYEPKTGHWINRHIIANKSIDMIVCSKCGDEFSYDAETGISEYDYCPKCGARMIEPQKRSEKE